MGQSDTVVLAERSAPKGPCRLVHQHAGSRSGASLRGLWLDVRPTLQVPAMRDRMVKTVYHTATLPFEGSHETVQHRSCRDGRTRSREPKPETLKTGIRACRRSDRPNPMSFATTNRRPPGGPSSPPTDSRVCDLGLETHHPGLALLHLQEHQPGGLVESMLKRGAGHR